MYRTLKVGFFIFLLSLYFSVNLYAGTPTNILRETIDEILNIVSNPHNKGDKNIKKRRSLIRVTLGKRFDYPEMTKRSLGRHWIKMTEADKAEFVKIFTLLLKTSYIKKIESYENENIKYISEKNDGKYSVCKTVIHTETNEIPVTYKMLLKTGRDWMVYDIVIEGVSLVSNYRRQFKRLISRKGYKKMVEKMRLKTEEIQREES